MTNTKKYVGGDKKPKIIKEEDLHDVEDEDNYIPSPAEYELRKKKKEAEEKNKNLEEGRLDRR
jgi:hypothetical protein